jgi:hypothetical protein
MTRASTKTKATILAGLGALALGCDDATDKSRPSMTVEEGIRVGDEVAPRVSANWIGHSLGVSPGKWRYAGKMKMAAPGTTWEPPVLNPDAPSVPNTRPSAVTLGDPRTGNMFDIEMADSDLKQIAAAMQARGLLDAQVPPGATVEEPSPEDVSKGWSTGVDNRLDRGIARLGVGSFPSSAIGQLKQDGTAEGTAGHCSAAFVGPRDPDGAAYIMSAAHCLWNRTTDEYLDPDFFPRHDRCRNNQNQDLASCNQSPFGVWDGGEWLMYTFFRDNCRTGTYTNECRANDIVIMRVHPPAGVGFPGSLGVAFKTKAFLDARTKTHRGYPNCGGAGDPVPTAPTVCLTRTLYGDGAFTLGTGGSLEGDQPRVYPHSSDTSGGHSGGPTYYSDGGSIFLFGVNVSESCAGAACTAARPNTLRAVTQDWLNNVTAFVGM